MPEINKIKMLNFLNKNKSKIIFVLTTTKEKKLSVAYKTQIIKFVTLFACLWSVDTTFIFLKSYSSILLVAKIKSIAAFRMLELSLELSDIFPKSKVCVKMLLVFSNKL